MRPTLIIAAAALSLVACANLDRPEATDLLLVSDGTYLFRARAQFPYPLDADWAERQRFEWLQESLAEDGACPHGYTIESRRVGEHKEGWTSVTSVFYGVKCKA
jgi:hypothetical protein